MNRVLVIEDDPAIGELIKGFLEMNEFGVTLTDNPITGVDFSKNGNFDAVVTDLNLPGMSCDDLIANLLKDRAASNIIIITGTDISIAKEKFGSFGFADILRKPFKFPELLSKLDQTIEA